MKKIKLKMGITSIAITAVVIACVIIINSIVGIFVESNPMKIDLTKDKVYEFSNQTKDVMKNLDADVKAYALIPEGLSSEYTDYIKPYLDKYKSLSKRFTVQYIDPYEDTAFVSKYANSEQEIGVGTVIIESGDKHKILTLDQLYTQSYFDNVEHIDMERQITNAVMIVTGKLSEASVCFDVSHTASGYENIGMFLEALLATEGYKCNYVNIITEGIPEDADVVISLMPVTDYNDAEIATLNEFLDRGGRFVLMANEGLAPMKNLDNFLEEWGIKLNYDYVIEADENSRIISYDGYPIPVAKMGEHTITEKIVSSMNPIVMPHSMSMSIVKSSNNSDAVQLLTTSEKAYGKKAVTTTLEKEDGDIEGPLCMAAVAVRWDKETAAVMVLGSIDGFADPNVIGDGNYLNADFLLNSLSYLSGAEEASDIRAKQITPETMIVTQQQYKVINTVLVYVIPVAIILLGLVIWLRRRFK